MESLHPSLWTGTTPELSYPSLPGDLETEVAVVGAGIAGILTAYRLLLSGKKVILLDAHQPLYGTTSFTTAKVTVLHGAKYHRLAESFGREKAEMYAASNSAGIDWLESLVNEEKIVCSWKRVDMYEFTNEKEMLKDLDAEFLALHDIGLPVTKLLDSTGHPFPFLSAIKLPEQAIFHPRRFLMHILELIEKKGGSIYGGSRVTDVKDGSPCVLTTERGTVKAKEVVIATNYPIVDTAAYYARMTQTRSYALAAIVDLDLPDDTYIGMGEKEITLRVQQEGDTRWAIVGNLVHDTGKGGDTEKHYQEIEQITRRILPVTEIGYRWSAQDAASPDGVPFTGRMPRTEHLYFTTGYGEWGMSTGAASAILLSDLVTGQENEWSALYDPSRFKVKDNLRQAAESGKTVLQSMSYGFLLADKEVNNLKPGEGKVVSREGEKLAVCRDEAGKLCALSAVCTHLGCIVNWNQAEKSWDCPCHGSRFDTEGDVIHSPAVKPLEKKEIQSP